MCKSERLYLSYDPLKLDFIAFKMDNISRRKRIADTDVVNDITCTRQSDITRVVIRFYDMKTPSKPILTERSTHSIHKRFLTKYTNSKPKNSSFYNMWSVCYPN